MPHPVIAMHALSKHYALAGGITSPVLKSIDLSITTGEFVSIMGPSGSGKSTLMNIIGTLDKASSGSYLLDGADISGYDDTALTHIRNRTIGFVFQGFNLLSRRSILDNIAMPLFYAGIPQTKRRERAAHYLNMVGLSSHASYLPAQLSGGQQQRIAIARALCGEPKLILADEPTGNLDSQTSIEIMDLFSDLSRKGITIILVTHEHSIARYGKRLIQLKDGEILYDGPMQ